MRKLVALLVGFVVMVCGGCGFQPPQGLGITLPYYGSATPTATQDPAQLDGPFAQEIQQFGVFPQTPSLSVEPATSINSLLAKMGFNPQTGGGGAWYQYLRQVHDDHAGVAPTGVAVVEMTSPSQKPNCPSDSGIYTPNTIAYLFVCLERQTGKLEQATVFLPFGFQEKVDEEALSTDSAVLKALVASQLYAEFLREEMPHNAAMYWPPSTLNVTFDACVAGVTLRALVPAGMDDQLAQAYRSLVALRLFANALSLSQAKIGYDSGDLTKCV